MERHLWRIKKICCQEKINLNEIFLEEGNNTSNSGLKNKSPTMGGKFSLQPNDYTFTFTKKIEFYLFLLFYFIPTKNFMNIKIFRWSKF
jgi:hypothetical protein